MPELGPHDALVMVMAAGVNFNNVWAARGVPGRRHEDPGAVGRADRLPHRGLGRLRGRLRGRRGGHERAGRRPRRRARRVSGTRTTRGSSPARTPGSRDSFRVWGYDTCWGSFAQFARSRPTSACRRPTHLTWEEAAAPTLTGATAYRMLFGWPPHTVEPGDVVLVWGGSGGLGSLADPAGRERRRARGRRRGQRREGRVLRSRSAPRATSTARTSRTGACRLRGTAPEWKDWFEGAKAFGKAIWDVLGEKTSPRIVFEHPGAGHDPHVDLRLPTAAAWS